MVVFLNMVFTRLQVVNILVDGSLKKFFDLEMRRLGEEGKTECNYSYKFTILRKMMQI